MAKLDKGKLFLKAVAHALFAGLEEVPGYGVAIKMARSGYEKLRELQDKAEQNDRIEQLEQAGACSPAEARAAAAEFIAEQRARGIEIAADKEAAILDLIAATPAVLREHTQATLRMARRQGSVPYKVLPVTGAFDEAEREAFYQSLLPARRPLFKPGDPLPHYNPAWKLQELLGAGGFGEVWRVRQDALGDQVAVKFCQDPASAKVLKREAETLTCLRKDLPRHDNIVALLDVQLTHEPYWLSFDYVEGGTLESRIRAGALSWEQAKTLFAPIVRGMAAVHQLGIVHRDLKPANILLDNDTPKISDFGIGKISAAQAEVARRTRTRFTTQGYGSLGYMSPEQEDGQAAHSADDTYALGVILWQMLAGSLRFPRYEDDVTELAAPLPAKQLISACRFKRRDKRPRDAGVLLSWLETDNPAQAREAEKRQAEAEQQARLKAEQQQREAQAAKEREAQRRAEEEQRRKAAEQQREAEKQARLKAEQQQREAQAAKEREAQRRAQEAEAARRKQEKRPRPSAGGGKWLGISLAVVLVIGVGYFQQRGENTRDVIPSRDNIPSSPPPTPSGKTFTDPATGMEFVEIPGGCFQMGSPETEKDRSSDEKQHQVCVEDFWMGKTEVTQAQWQKIMGTNPAHFKGANRPVESVYWSDAQDFLKKLSAPNMKRNGYCMMRETLSSGPINTATSIFRMEILLCIA